MVGNDVVDLRDGETRPLDPARFDARVFCETELRGLARGADRGRQRWRLWAAKEAAYKAAVREDPATVFSPVCFRVHLDGPGPGGRGDPEREGWVEMPGGVVPVRVSEQAGAVHAVVGSGSGTLAAAMRVSPGDPGPAALAAETRRFARRRIARALGAGPADVEIRKRGRLPELWIGGRCAGPLSLSHHGSVVGFAWELPR
jgi:hypothetical protein